MVKYKILRYVFCSIIALLFLSCKLTSTISTAEFSRQLNLNEINGTYLLPERTSDSLHSGFPIVQNAFTVEHLVKDGDKDIVRNKKFEKLSVFFNGKDKVTFTFFNQDEKYSFTYKCKRKDDYLEIYFKKTRIWALPLFMNYQYDRIRLGLDENSELLIHKWNTILFTLTIMPFDPFGHSDYREVISRTEND